jgi:hypothetical protein
MVPVDNTGAALGDLDDRLPHQLVEGQRAFSQIPVCHDSGDGKRRGRG